MYVGCMHLVSLQMHIVHSNITGVMVHMTAAGQISWRASL